MKALWLTKNSLLWYILDLAALALGSIQPSPSFCLLS